MIYLFKFIDFIIALYNQLDFIQITLILFMGAFLILSIYSLILIFKESIIDVKKEVEKRVDERMRGEI
ncbi:hypothetical protein [Arcobacter sp. YIC-310]|uniref:hypothetical protein n=1 Tax=Arcobacter sp. YIC-310 TaxID=3376632 RepID=UPI003C29AEA1